MGSIVEYDGLVSMSDISIVSKISSIEGGEYNRELVALRLTFKLFKVYLKGSRVSLEMFQL